MVESLFFVALPDPAPAPEGVPPAFAADADPERARRFDDPDAVDVDAELRRFDRELDSLEASLDDDRDEDPRRFDRDPEPLDDRDEELRRFDPELDPLEASVDDDRDDPLDDREDRLDDDREPEPPVVVEDDPPVALADVPLEDPPSSVRHALGSGMPDVRLAT